MSGPVSNCCFMLDNLKEKSFLVKCEVLGISAMNFYSAVKFYDRKKRTISDNKSENAKPIYKIQLHCTDSSLSPNELVEVWVLSYDGKCSDFVKSFRLKDFNELSSQKHEDIMYEKRVNELL